MKRFAIMGSMLIAISVLSTTCFGRTPSAPEVKATKVADEGTVMIFTAQCEADYIIYKAPVKTAPAVATAMNFYDPMSFVQPLIKRSLYASPMRRQVIEQNKGPGDKIYAELGYSISSMRARQFKQ